MELTENQKKMVENIALKAEIDDDSMTVVDLMKECHYGRDKAQRMIDERVVSGEWEQVYKTSKKKGFVISYRIKKLHQTTLSKITQRIE
jgi:hypothetical protein